MTDNMYEDNGDNEYIVNTSDDEEEYYEYNNTNMRDEIYEEDEMIYEEKLEMENKKNIIIEYVRRGNIQKIKNFILENREFNMSFDEDFVFLTACELGYLNIAKFLIKTISTIDINASNNYSFYSSCGNGHIEVGKWLLTIDPNILNNNLELKTMKKAVQNGHLNVLKWLYSLNPNVNLSDDNEDLFRKACTRGYLNISKWLLTEKPDINISIDEDDIYLESIGNGHIKVSKWLLSINPGFKNERNLTIAFRNSCQRGNLEAAKYLYKLNDNNIIAKTTALHDSYLMKKYEICEWLLSIYDEWDLSFLKYHIFRYREYSEQKIDKDLRILFNNYIRKWLKINIKIENIECSICFDNKKKSYIKTPCNHIFCKKCINEWMNIKNSCPYCRCDI